MNFHFLPPALALASVVIFGIDTTRDISKLFQSFKVARSYFTGSIPPKIEQNYSAKILKKYCTHRFCLIFTNIEAAVGGKRLCERFWTKKIEEFSVSKNSAASRIGNGIILLL